MPDNPNYHQTSQGWERKPNAPDAGHKSRVDWNRQQNLANIRQGIADGRAKQNAINEAHKQKHGGG